MVETVNAPQEKSATGGQIEEVVSRLRAEMWKHRHELSFETFQKILGLKNLEPMLLGMICKLVEEMSEFVTVTVQAADPNRDPQDLIDATGCIEVCVEPEALGSMPRPDGKKKEIILFPGKRDMHDVQIEARYRELGLKPANPHDVLQAYVDGLVPVDTITVWQNGHRLCFVICRPEFRSKRLLVRHSDGRWCRGHFTYAGVLLGDE